MLINLYKLEIKDIFSLIYSILQNQKINKELIMKFDEIPSLRRLIINNIKYFYKVNDYKVINQFMLDNFNII